VISIKFSSTRIGNALKHRRAGITPAVRVETEAQMDVDWDTLIDIAELISILALYVAGVRAWFLALNQDRRRLNPMPVIDLSDDEHADDGPLSEDRSENSSSSALRPRPHP
jgi:hypothetical protein